VATQTAPSSNADCIKLLSTMSFLWSSPLAMQ
jgi:hypothetical protein